MLVVAFMTVSLAGFWRLATGRGHGAPAAWIGAGLAAATKGIPAMARVGFSVAAGGTDRAGLRSILRPVPIALGVIIAFTFVDLAPSYPFLAVPTAALLSGTPAAVLAARRRDRFSALPP